MDETATRRKKIDPKLYGVGWEQVPDSEILTEQSAYLIAPGRVEKIRHSKPKKADYVLEYKGKKLAVIEAKSDERPMSDGVPQAKLYAEMLQIRYTYATNGDEIWAIDMGVKDAEGNYIIPSKEGPVTKFPSPQELWLMTYPEENEWRDRFNLCAFNRDGGRMPRYYQENAINRVLDAVANKQNRILLTMATGTGKTYTAFQICWKLFQTNWNKDHIVGRKPRILFIADRNILANQARNDFDNFKEDAMVRVTPEELRKSKGKVPMSRHLYFTIFQTFMCNDDSGHPYFMQYPKDFFDFIIIDECHRGGANDESEWRGLMEYFDSACQLGMTATPRRKENSNTYQYFGQPVYSYSLKNGIADGYLTPFRVWISHSNIDSYQYDPEDDVEGEIDVNRTYTERDFYNGNIEMRDRDEHRVKEVLKMIAPDEKTIIFCAKQSHAAAIRDMVNQYKSRPDSNYCMRVTAEDGDEGERQLKMFQDNERLRPTILTTSQKLSTGVDARNVRNIVLMRPVNSMVEFKQIVGRGTRLFDDKYYFTIYDFVGASDNFKDVEWDGDPFCPVCGNYPCSCNKNILLKYPNGEEVSGVVSVAGEEQTSSYNPLKTVCLVCGHLPCTCPGNGGRKKNAVIVRLSLNHKVMLYTDWEEKVQFGEELLSVEELIEKLFGEMPTFFKSAEDLRMQWEHPQTRQVVLDRLEQAGFGEDKLQMIQRVMRKEDCDLLDVLSYLAYSQEPIERHERVEAVKTQYLAKLGKEHQEFLAFILDYYQRNGFRELAMDKLKDFISIKYRSISDAKKMLGTDVQGIREEYLMLQKQLYMHQKG